MTRAHPTLFSPLVLGGVMIRNRVALASRTSGCASRTGRVSRALATHYLERARGDVGLVVLEPALVRAPTHDVAHLGLYDDGQIAALTTCITALHAVGSAALVMLDQPGLPTAPRGIETAELGAAFVMAAWRARSAGADGVMLSTCDDGPLTRLLSPVLSRADEQPASDLESRLWLLLNIVEGIVRWLGPQFLVGVRLLVEEFTPGGLELHDARVIACRLVSSGVGLLEIGTRAADGGHIAQFPGWKLPLAAAIREVTDVPVLVGGELDDPWLADSAVRDGSADLIDVGSRLQSEPHWARQARTTLANRQS